MKIFFVVLWTVKIFLLTFCHDILPSLSCQETRSSTLEAFPASCNFSMDTISCTHVLWPRQRHFPMDSMNSEFRILPQTPIWTKGDTARRNVTFCVELHKMEKVHKDQTHMQLYMYFSCCRTLAVGVASMSENCWNMFKTCAVEVKLRVDVLDLPFASESPDYKDFWNFSSPFFRPELRWLRELHVVNIENRKLVPIPSSTSGTSLELVSIRGLPDFKPENSTLHITNMPWLRLLDLFQVEIQHVSPETFIGCPFIKYLDLSRNRLSEIPHAIKRLKHLKYLQIESNIIDFNLTSESLVPLRKLRYLSLGGTSIGSWEVPIPPLPLLLSLSLSDCSLIDAGPAPFDFPALKILDLSRNYNITLAKNTFIKLRKLQHLILRRCAFSKWPTFPPNRFVTLDLSENNFTTLVNLGKQGVTVEMLDVSQNKIFQWDDPELFLEPGNNEKFSHLDNQDQSPYKEKFLFGTSDAKSKKQISVMYGKTHNNTRAAWVQQVNLSLNSIAAFTPAMLESLSALSVVDLGGNHIDCSNCRTPALQKWLRRAGSTVKVLVLGERQPLRCFLPPALEGAPVVGVQFDASACRDPTVRLRWALGVSLAVALSVLLLSGALGFCYRTEVAYLVHLARVRASSRRPADPCGCSYDAFVCYSGKNRKWVLRRLVPLLERRPERYVLCLFDRDFRLGTQIVSNIVDAIERSRKVIVVLTQRFIDSKWCQWELEMAQHKLFSEDREFLVLLELEPLERRRLPRLLRFLLDTRPVVRWPRPETAPAVMAAAAQLRRALGPSLRQRPHLAPPPSPSTAPEDQPGPSASATDERTPLLASM